MPFEKLKKVPGSISRQTDPGIFGFNLLRLPADAITDASYVGELPYWDGIEALYGYSEGMTYIRFRNGDDPGNMALKASTGNETFLIKDQSHIILKNFYIGGSWHSVIIKGKKATGNIIEGNYITHGRTRVLLEDGAAGNIIENNIMTLNYHGYDNPGAWGIRTTSLAKTRCHIYQEFKHTVGPNGSDDHGVEVRRAGAGNIVRDNRIKGGLIGVHVRTTPRLQVSRNIISNMSSIGICTSRGTNEAIFNNNLVYDCNINLRIHHFNELDSNLKRKEYYYRNIFYFPEKTSGCNLFVHLIPANSPNQIKNLDDEPEIFFYHNTLVGGVGLQQATEMKKTVLLNNIFSYSPEFVITRYKKRRGQPELFEVMDHNLMVAPEGFPDREYPKWLGKNNIYVTAPLKWEADRFFEISGNSIYREKGIDLSKKFIFNGKEYEPFPGMEPGYFKGEKPDIGALQYGEKAGSWFTRELRESNSLP